MAEALAPPEPGRPPRRWLRTFISAAFSLLTASNRPVLHAESFHTTKLIRVVRHTRPIVWESDGGDPRVMRADGPALAFQFLSQTADDGGEFVIEGHRGLAVEDQCAPEGQTMRMTCP